MTFTGNRSDGERDLDAGGGGGSGGDRQGVGALTDAGGGGEILEDIFVHVNQIRPLLLSYGEIPLGRKSLAALARTCTTFHEPAMNELWADLDEHGIEPLLGCVTRLHPMVYRSGGRYTWPEGVDPLSEHEAHQFLRHAARVRSLHISFDVHFHLLSIFPIETCIFPRLQSLIWGLPTDTNLGLFLSPMLHRCRLSAIDGGFKCIATRCNALEDLSIRIFEPCTVDELSLLSDSVRLHKRLVTLSCPALDWTAWEHLSNIPTLITVVINMGNRVPCPPDLDSLNFAPFLNLTALSLYVDTPAYITTLVQHSEFPSLKKFEIIVNALPSNEAERLFRALSQCKACQTLEHITMGTYGPGVQEPSDNPLTVIAHFFCFTQLRTLWLMLHRPIFLDNNLLLEAMSSWPHIRTLSLEEPHCRPATITFRGLFTALRRCPHLQTLDVLIDTARIDIDDTAESFQHTTLRSLGLIPSSHVVDAEAVSRIIFSTLPCVDRLSKCTEGWQIEVNKYSTSISVHLKGPPESLNPFVEAQMPLMFLLTASPITKSTKLFPDGCTVEKISHTKGGEVYPGDSHFDKLSGHGLWW
ncbi:uncharacterized protein EDB91DRAFT_1080672 [Suillus paluster]|uniref:uncharacterized protein n=1 Tax=Suillus paluster TaxID=48578 RepID=UPI001B85F4F4|nr:uncharacterized protein EDB91DRAFT_1080672 [Suillus paluster]KAG1744561.1 hypothetical protein EDB91DRAFT_1080672 [Suillus paluster]